MKTAVITALMVAGIVLGTGSVQAGSSADVINAKYKLSEKAFAENNVEILLEEFYSKDVFVVGEGSSPVIGHEQLATVLEELVQGAKRIELTSERADHQSDDTVYDFVNYRVFPSDDSPAFNVRSLLVWKKVGGDWRVSADMYTFGDYK